MRSISFCRRLTINVQPSTAKIPQKEHLMKLAKKYLRVSFISSILKNCSMSWRKNVKKKKAEKQFKVLLALNKKSKNRILSNQLTLKTMVNLLPLKFLKELSNYLFQLLCHRNLSILKYQLNKE